MELEFAKQDDEKDEKLKSPKKSKHKIVYEQEKEQDNNQQMDAEKDIQQNILEICLQIFPYPEPYSIQIESMKSIIKSLCEKKNLLFQSPTGTGKTLVTICSALAYAIINPNVQVFVLTRTNEQINGFIKEIRKIRNYADISRYSILAGRGSFCLNIDKIKSQIQMLGTRKSKYNKNLSKICNLMKQKLNCNCGKCKTSIIAASNDDIDEPFSIFQRYKQVDINQRSSQNKQDQDQQEKNCYMCPHYRIYQQIKEKKEKETIKMNLHFPQVRSASDQAYTLPDIEDMKKLFQQKNLGCPFYFNKLATQNAKLVFSTYNYVIKQNILASIQNLFKGKVIVIFDEAHNVSEQAEQEQIIKMSNKYFEQFNNTLEKVQKIFQKPQRNEMLQVGQDIRALIQLDIKQESLFLKEQLLKRADKQKQNKSDIQDKNGEADYDNDEDEEKFLQKYKHAKYNSYAVNTEQKLYKRKFNQNILFSSKDLYDLALSTINQSSQVSDDSPQCLQQIQNYIKDSNINKSQIDVESIFKLYQEQRIKEVYYFLDNFQNLFLTIKEKCGFLEKIFDQNNKSQIQQFCKLFSDKEIVKQFEQLKVNDVDSAQKFLGNLEKVFKIILYIKKVIKINTEEDIEQKDQQNKDIQGENIIVKENNNEIYELNINYKNNIKKLGEQIEISYFSKIWHFFYKLLKMRKLHGSQEDPLYLSNHYISLLRIEEQQFIPILQIGCLSASYLFKKIYKKIDISSLILTSGTLEPFELIQKSLGLEFQTYTSPHIIHSQSNLFTQFISSCDGQDICFSMNALKKEKNKNKIFQNSQIVLNKIMSKLNRYSQQVKEKCGIVIFFKSYQMLQQYKYMINMTKNADFKFFEEKRDANDFKIQYSSYKQSIQQNKSNCIFLAVNRGKLSEGIDLKDNLCRAVILFGVPYANLSDPYIICKKTHAQLYLGESQWYQKDAVKVVNQSAGRCIRYKDDWGCIFFLDSQYSLETNINQHISKWILEGQRKIYKDSEDEWIEAYDNFLDMKALEKTDQDQS